MNQFILSGNTKKYLYTFNIILSDMREGMTANSDEVRLTASISADFIIRMVPHHAAAVKMCENLLLYTTNIYLQHMAKNIITMQSQGIMQMQDMYYECFNVKNNEESLKKYKGRYDAVTEKMFYDMGNARQVNNIDCDFVAEMIPHHTGALYMTQNALRYDICPPLKEVMHNIVSMQSKGVTELKKFQKACC